MSAIVNIQTSDQSLYAIPAVVKTGIKDQTEKYGRKIFADAMAYKHRFSGHQSDGKTSDRSFTVDRWGREYLS